MFKSDTNLQYSIFDALEYLSSKKKLQKLSKREYQLLFIDLTKNLVNDYISLDEYKTSLSAICDCYRKDYKNV